MHVLAGRSVNVASRHALRGQRRAIALIPQRLMASFIGRIFSRIISGLLTGHVLVDGVRLICHIGVLFCLELGKL